jgi:uncharacterized membrane protein
VWLRFIVYGLGGWCAEVIWTALGDRLSGRQSDWRLRGTTYLWMFPLYGMLAIFYEPLHDRLRSRHVLMRAMLYMLGLFAGEFGAGWLLQKLIGACPWDYTRFSRRHVRGFFNLDYAPVWALAGLALEPVHDWLVRLTPAIRQAAQTRREPHG